MRFFDHLPAELEGREFRVIAPSDGGYWPFLELALYDMVLNPYIDVLARLEFDKILVRVYLEPESFALNNGDKLDLSGADGEILTPDGSPSGQTVLIGHLNLRLNSRSDGETVGSLYMWLSDESRHLKEEGPDQHVIQ